MENSKSSFSNIDIFEWVRIILGITFIVGIILTVIKIIHHDTTVIDRRVETIDGKIYDCVHAYASDNGMTYIGKPYYIQIPTKTVKVIKRLD